MSDQTKQNSNSPKQNQPTNNTTNPNSRSRRRNNHSQGQNNRSRTKKDGSVVHLSGPRGSTSPESTPKEKNEIPSSSDSPEATGNHTNLIVRNLPPVTTEEDLQAIFGPCGQIDSAKIMYDPVSGMHKGFGFVKFVEPEAARTATQTLNGFTINNQAIIVELARSSFKGGGVEQGTPSEKVFVKNMPLTWNETDVHSCFSRFGVIQSIKVLPDGTGAGSRGQSILTFSSMEEAKRAIQSLNNHQVPGTPNKLLLRFAHTEQEKASQHNRFPYTAFSPYGFATPPAAQPLPGSFITPTNSFLSVALPSIATPNGFNTIPSSQPNSITYEHVYQPNQDANVYVSNLPENADDSLLYQLFGPFGAVISVAVRQNPQGKIGFCRMARVEDAWNAIQSLNGTKLRPEDHKSLFVQFKKEKKRT